MMALIVKSKSLLGKSNNISNNMIYVCELNYILEKLTHE